MAGSIEYHISVKDETIKDILVARLSFAGATGFEEGKQYLKAFIAADEGLEMDFESIIGEMQLGYTKSVIPEKNWNEEWESGFEPVTIHGFCTIRAAFHPPATGAGHDIIITPKMSFGTGHHATTFLMVEAMQQLDFEGKTVFDFGTGTGVLSILALQCGAKTVTAIDNDDWSITNAVENFKINHCDNILLYKRDRFLKDEKFDIILANINRNVILEHLPAMQQHLLPGGMIVLSGLLEGDEPAIAETAGRNRLMIKQTSRKEGWVCLEVTEC